MKRCIFSLYIDVDKNSFEKNQDLEKNILTKNELKNNYDFLVSSQKKYARQTSADYIIFGADDQYAKYAQQFESNISVYNIINFYKIHLLYMLAETYDEVLYLDLDVVISGNIDKLLTWQPNHWCIVKDYTRAMRPSYQKYNSSVIKFKTGELGFVWDKYKQDPEKYQKLFFGDQDYLYDVTHKEKAAMLYPDSWTQSWKWEVRQSREFAPGGVRDTENPQGEDFIKNYSYRCPMNRLAEVEEIVGPILFLISEESSYINGHTLVIDGGMSAW